jgi:hypothetical protein
MNLPARRKILYLGNLQYGETSDYRFKALQRLDQEVIPFQITGYDNQFPLLHYLRLLFPSGPLIAPFNRAVLQAVKEHKPDVVWMDKPIHIAGETLETIRRSGALSVSFVQDNPFGPRKDRGWNLYLRTFRQFDLHCLFRNIDVIRFQEWNLPYVQLMFSYDPAMHFPPPTDWTDQQRSREVSYIGSPLEKRPQFLRALAEQHQIPLVIDGPHWQKLFTPELMARYVSKGQLMGDAYREAIWKSKINLSFVTELNEDDISHKSVEIAACAGFLLAIRCAGHQACFEEDREAVFFSSIEECTDKIRFYLPRPELRHAMGLSAQSRTQTSGYDNDTQLAKALNKLDGK